MLLKKTQWRDLLFFFIDFQTISFPISLSYSCSHGNGASSCLSCLEVLQVFTSLWHRTAFVCRCARLCVGGGKLSRCIRNKRAGEITESTFATPCVFEHVRRRASVGQRKTGSVIKLSTRGICQGKQHTAAPT